MLKDRQDAFGHEIYDYLCPGLIIFWFQKKRWQ